MIEDIPPALTSRPGFVKPVNGVWVEKVMPTKGNKFIAYGSAGPQIYYRVHKETEEGDKVVGECLLYVYDGMAVCSVHAYINDILTKNGVEKHQHSLVMNNSVELEGNVIIKPAH